MTPRSFVALVVAAAGAVACTTESSDDLAPSSSAGLDASGGASGAHADASDGSVGAWDGSADHAARDGSVDPCECEQPNREVMALSCVSERLPDPWADPQFWDVACSSDRSTTVRQGSDCLVISLFPGGPLVGDRPLGPHAESYTFDPSTLDLRALLISWEHIWCEYAPHELCVAERCATLCGEPSDDCDDPTLAAEVGLTR